MIAEAMLAAMVQMLALRDSSLSILLIPQSQETIPRKVGHFLPPKPVAGVGLVGMVEVCPPPSASSA